MLAAMIPCHNYQILKVRIIRMWDWIVQILFQALELIQRFAGDWGLSIIILVVIIRLLLTPMMLKSIKSTARMQVLQPKLLEIQERYAADPQRQAEELQKFYSENKFNPFGGCLPLLIQMPILVALFNLLRDLGHYFPDAAEKGFSFFNILPNLVTSPAQAFADGFGAALPYLIALILFGVLTFIPQMYMTRNQTGAQVQSTKMMMVVMTVMMLVMGLGYARRRSAVLRRFFRLAGRSADLCDPEGHRQGQG